MAIMSNKIDRDASDGSTAAEWQSDGKESR